MSHHKSKYSDEAALARAIAYARGDRPVPLVLRHGEWFDVFSGKFRIGDVAIAEGKIVGIGEAYEAEQIIDAAGLFIVPGFIDSHVHIESSLMTPARFQELALPSGTTTAIWDPHEIANVLGVAGIQWALDAIEKLLLDIFVMIPSCVPSTNAELAFETSGASLKAKDIAGFVRHPRVLGLAEMMNFPGLLHQDPDILQKIIDFQQLRLDGHCPGLKGKDLNAYAVAGIHSCHESTTAIEASEKLSKGIHVLIREGSCAKDAEALLPLLSAYTSTTMGLCSDDRNPLDILDEGHISFIVDKALRAGHKPEDIFRAASYATAKLYGLADRGAVAPGYQADLCLVRPKTGDWNSGLSIESVIKKGQVVVQGELKKQLSSLPRGRAKNLNLSTPLPSDLCLAAQTASVMARVIEVIPGQILTRSLRIRMPIVDGEVAADPKQDILKIIVLERHHGTDFRSVGLVQGFGLKSAAIATSINHDSHNIIAVGSSDELILAAIADLIAIDGGICVRSKSGKKEQLALPIAGLMTDIPPQEIAESLRRLKTLTRESGCQLSEPFLQLSFLALPVIPSLKITDRALIDVDQFCKVPVLFVDDSDS
jgi:adenine deaminase